MLEGLSQRGQPSAVGEPVGHHRHDHAGDDADEAEQSPQADDRKGALPQRQGVDDAREQHLLGDRHDAERDAGQHHHHGLLALDDEHRQRALVNPPDRHGLSGPCRVLDRIPLPIMPEACLRHDGEGNRGVRARAS